MYNCYYNTAPYYPQPAYPPMAPMGPIARSTMQRQQQQMITQQQQIAHLQAMALRQQVYGHPMFDPVAAACGMTW